MYLRSTLFLCFVLSTAPFGTGGNSESVFHVDKTVGTIIIAKPLDAEQQFFYNLTVQATDGTKTAFTQVPHSFPSSFTYDLIALKRHLC